MNFANPAALILLPIFILMAWLREKKSTEFTAHMPYPSLAALKSLSGTWRTHWLRVPSLLIAVGISLSIVALARPRSLVKGEEAHVRGIDVMITLDTSGSMRALDFDPQDRMAVAKKATHTFITHRQVDRIGLVVFAGVALLQCPLTLDYAALLDFLSQVEVGITSTENTSIGTAIATAANHLKRSTAKSKIIILVTDGRSNSGEIDPITAAKAAGGLNVKIYSIGVGVRGQSFIPVDTMWGKQRVPIAEDLDEPSLQQIAQSTGGRYYRAASAKEFEQIYSEIDQLEKTDVKGPSTREYKDLYLGWLLAAMACLSAGYGLQMTLWRTLP